MSQAQSPKSETVLITGASAGIGEACAELFAERGYSLIVTGRREPRLAELAARLTKAHGVSVKPLIFDVSDRRAAEAALAAIGAQLPQVAIVVNNAGLAIGTEPMPSANVDDWDAMIDTNVKGLLYVTRALLPPLIARAKSGKNAHIVNIGSVAGHWTYPGGGVYSATKFAVRALTQGLRMDLMGTGVRVTAIEPGMVETEFSEVRFAGDKTRAQAVYRGMTPLQARDIAESVVWCAERPAHVNIQELMIFPTDQAGVGPGYTHRK